MFKAAEPWTDAANGTCLQFTTTPTGTANWAERMRTTPAGYVGIGASTPQLPLNVRLPNRNTYASLEVDTSGGLFLIANSPQIGFNLSYPTISPKGTTPAGRAGQPYRPSDAMPSKVVAARISIGR